MKILGHQQVTYCNLVSRRDNNIEYLPGLIFQNKFFIKDKVFALDKKTEAQQYGRQEFLQHKGQKQYILLEDPTGLTLSTQDDSVELFKQSNEENSSATINLKELISVIRGDNGIEIKERRYRLKLYPDCFVGSELVDWMVTTLSIPPEKAVQIGQLLIEKKLIHHVHDEHSFKNEFLFYRFYCDEKNS